MLDVPSEPLASAPPSEWVAEPDGDAPPIADGRPRRLALANVRVERIGAWIMVGMLAVAFPFCWALLALTTELARPILMALAGGFLVIFLGAALLAHTWPPLDHRHTSWRLSRRGFEIRRGVVWRHLITVPRERIQHTDVTQGPIQRRFGLASLVVHTAGTENFEVTLSGLSQETARAIRDELLVRRDDR